MVVSKEIPFIAGTIGGFLASTIPNIGSQQLFTTCILAIIGAIVSFFTTLLLRKIVAVSTTYFSTIRRWFKKL